MKTIILFILAGLLVTSCSKKNVPTIARQDSIQKITITERIHDTTILVLQDSSQVQYLIECENERAKLTQFLSYKSGSRVQPPQVTIVKNVLTAKCVVDSFAVYASFKTRDTTMVLKTNTVTIVPQNYVTGFQSFQIWLGRILLVILFIYFGLKLIRAYTGGKLLK